MTKASPVVAFLGPEGSYTHQATLTRFPAQTHTLSPQRTIPDIFTAVATHAADIGVVPFENSTNGNVVTTLDLLASWSSLSATTKPQSIPDGVQVISEIYQPVSHGLGVSRSLLEKIRANGHGSGNDGDEEDAEVARRVTRVYSHPQAWGQCVRFLSSSEAWKRVEKQDVSSTSRAAELVAAEGPESTSAAIASPVALELHGLVVWKAGIEDVKGNATRFLVLGPSSSAAAAAAEEEKEGRGTDDEAFKTLVLFVVSHYESGALADSLAVFKRFGLNLTSINTRPSGHVIWNYVFFVELIGRKWSGRDDGKVNEALRELDKVAKEWRWMGSWKNQRLLTQR